MLLHIMGIRYTSLFSYLDVVLSLVITVLLDEPKSKVIYLSYCITVPPNLELDPIGVARILSGVHLFAQKVGDLFSHSLPSKDGRKLLIEAHSTKMS